MSRSFTVPRLSLVTGAANGLGLEISRKIMAARGMVVAIDHDIQQLEKLHLEHPGLCIPISTNLAQLNDIDTLTDKIAAIVAKRGPFKLVLFNAAISATGRFELIPDSVHRQIFSLNSISPMIMASQMVQKSLMDQGSAMVFISSLSHQTGYPGAATYAASKDAIAVYAKSIARSYARKKIHVMRVFPGPIRTRMAEQHAPKSARPGKRMSPEKMALRILHAASQGQPVLFPDAMSQITAAISKVLPRAVTKLMRKIIFEKLDREIY